MSIAIESPRPHYDQLNWLGKPHTHAKVLILCFISAAILPLYLSIFRMKLAGITVRASDFFAIISIIGTLMMVPASRRVFLYKPLMILYTLSAYIILHGMINDNISASIKEAIQHAFLITTLGISWYYIETHPKLFRKFFFIMLWVSMLYTVLYHLSIGQYLRYKYAHDGKYIFGLLTTTTLLLGREKRWPFKWKAMLILSLIPLALSLERKGILGVCCVASLLFMMKVLTNLKINISFFFTTSLFCILTLLYLQAEEIITIFDQLMAKNAYIDEGIVYHTSNLHRQSLLLNGVDIFRSYWLFGAGADMIVENMQQYYIDSRLAGGTHNFFLDNLIKYGVFGTALLGYVMFHKVRLPRSSYKKTHSHLLFSVYCFFAIFFMSDGLAATYLALFPAFCSKLFATSKSEGSTKTSW